MNGLQVGVANTVSLAGLQGKKVMIEATLLNGLPNFIIVGLPDTAVNEAKERLRASFYNLGIQWPNKRLTVNLSPADMAKSGAGFDLGIATAIIGALGFSTFSSQTLVLGELGLDGSVRGISGVLPRILVAKKLGFQRVVLPQENLAEARIVPDLEFVSVSHLSQIAVMLQVPKIELQEIVLQPKTKQDLPITQPLDFADVYGQDEVIWALEIAASGGHHVQMLGSPGIGKSMLAERFPTILPALTTDEAMEVAAIRSLCGEAVSALPTQRPISAPHHSATVAALIGGGSGIPRPGAISRAHHGVLYCDEFSEFKPTVIQALRQPLETGQIDLDRARAHVQYPAKFQLLTASNPCKCGFLLDGNGKCVCTSRERINYQNTLGGPIKDRIDISLVLTRPTTAALKMGGTLKSAQVKERVVQAREKQYRRNKNRVLNSQLSGKWLRKHTAPSENVTNLFTDLLGRGELSMRGVDRVLRLGWSIADLNNRDRPNDDDLMTAFMLRGEATGKFL